MKPKTRREEKEIALGALFSEWRDCQKCPLHETRTQVVYGDGNADADIAIIGIGPGEEEDREGVPFYPEAPSGEICLEYLERVGLCRDDVFLANVVSCRPFSRYVDHKTKRMREENRDPSTLERDACMPFWQEMLYIVDPILVIAMGRPAIQEVCGNRSMTVNPVQGLIQRCVIKRRAVEITYPVMCMFHPAFLARSGDKFRGGPWHKTLISWRKAMWYLDHLKEMYYGVEVPDRGYKESELTLLDQE